METDSVVTLKIQKASDLAIIPEYQTPGSSGMDVCSIENHTLYPGERTLIQTGLRLEIPEGYEIQVRPRSGLALKHGITVLNTPGTVDSSYRGLLGIILINQGKDKFEIEKGFRIAQIVLCPVAHAKIEVVSEVSETVRGEGGFGSTGIK